MLALRACDHSRNRSASTSPEPGRALSRAFDDALAAAGGSLPTWLVVTALKGGDHTMQRDVAAAVGIEDATLTHHLNRMEARRPRRTPP